jgi:HK97 family phage portal protein
MGALTTILLDRAQAWQKRFTLRNPEQWFIDYFGGGKSSAGVTVGHRSALSYTPFWAAVRIISGTIGALPFKVYRRLEDGGKEPLSQHPVYWLLHERPNDYVDAVSFLETRMAHVLCYGNGYAEIQRNGAGRPIALWPLLPTRTRRRVTEDGLPYYEVTLPAGGTVQLPDYNVLHIKGLGFDGYTGYDVVTYHKEALGYGVAVNKFGARFFANNASPGGVVEHPGPGAMGEKAYGNFKRSWEEAHGGLENAHRVAILEEGAKWHEFMVDPQKAQALEVQKYNVDDCSRIFNIPPHMLGSTEFSKYNTNQELRIEFLTMTMLYWFRKWEQEVNYKLLMPSERARIFCEIMVEALLRGNLEARTAFYSSGRQWGYLTINDIRAKNNMNPIGPAGDVCLDPLNMTPAGSLPASPAPRSTAPVGGNAVKIREAHRDLLIAQWRRIITKQANAAKGRPLDPLWWQEHRRWAHDLTRGPATAYAATRGIAAGEADIGLMEIINEWINDDVPLGAECAEIIAERIIERIGGNHHAISE